jgi:hypothetical protein
MVGGMDIEQGGLTAEQGEKSQSGYSILQIVIGALMLWQGLKNNGGEPAYSDMCPNGAAEYLYIAGILLLVINLFGLIAVVAQKCAMKDGKISCGEQCGLNLLSFITGMMWLGDLGLAIWGSVVVFGAYSTWTYEGDNDAVDGEGNAIFCDYTCFMFAFVLLILRWCTMPFAICCGCMKLMCKGCPKGPQAS